MTSTTATGIAYDDQGAGEPALLGLPGWCGPRTVFDPLLPLLAEHHRVLTVDWRGHGESAAAEGDFGFDDLVDDAISVLDTAGVRAVVPVAVSHAGWAAIALRKRLGAERVPKLVLLDWMVLGPPPPFLDALAGMRDPATTRSVVDGIISMWASGIDNADLAAYLKEMAATPDEMWQRAAREIGAAFAETPRPSEVIGSMQEPPSTLHLYAQPGDDAILAAQTAFAGENPWFHVERLPARSHFPMFEVPELVAEEISRFVR